MQRYTSTMPAVPWDSVLFVLVSPPYPRLATNILLLGKAPFTPVKWQRRIDICQELSMGRGHVEYDHDHARGSREKQSHS